jgi:CPA2 family monovalent cation:H+ antiporter-2/glutathione-regulated potassium-efflux system protein KefB
MHGEAFFFQAFIYLASAVIMVPLAKKLGLGSVLGYLLAGVVIGPFGLGLVGDEGEDVMHFAEFGVVMMLFVIGLELEPAVLWRRRASVLGLGGLQVLLTTLLLAALGLWGGIDWRAALAVGMSLALSSTAIVLQTLQEKGLMRTDGGQNAFSVLLFQDVAVIPMLALMPLLVVAASDSHVAAGHGESLLAAQPGWVKTAAVLGAVALVVLAGRYLLRPLFRIIARTRLRELFTAGGLLLIIGIALLMSHVGLSPALGTFLAGVLLASSEYRHELESTIDPFKGLLLGLFFISVGASLDFWLVIGDPLRVLGLVAALFVAKLAVLLVLGRLFRMSLDQNLLFSLALAQGGEFAFVLLSFATQSGVVEDARTSLIYAVVVLSMALAPLALLLNEKLIQPRFGTRERDEREPDAIDETNPVIIAGFGRFGNVTGRLLLANGVGATVLDVDSDHVDMLRQLGLKVFYGDASRLDLLHSAGADKAKLFIVAVDRPEKSLEIVRTVREHFPHLTILARAYGRPHAYDLLDAGVTQIFRETLESSLRMGVEALHLLGFRTYQAHRAAQCFRERDVASVQELAALRADRGAYLSRAREMIRDLEQVIRDDRCAVENDHDAAWDSESLRGDSTLREGD